MTKATPGRGGIPGGVGRCGGVPSRRHASFISGATINVSGGFLMYRRLLPGAAFGFGWTGVEVALGLACRR